MELWVGLFEEICIASSITLEEKIKLIKIIVDKNTKSMI